MKKNTNLLLKAFLLVLLLAGFALAQKTWTSSPLQPITNIVTYPSDLRLSPELQHSCSNAELNSSEGGG